MDNLYVFFNNNTLDIISLVQPNNGSFNIDEFKKTRVKLDPAYAGLSISDIGCVEEDSEIYNKFTKSGVNYKLIINPLTKKLDIKTLVNENMDNKYLIYGAQEHKRNYSIEDIYDMYNNDYINFNLKNIAQSGALDLRYVLLKNLNIRSTVGENRWESFFTDPYLKEMGDDKLKLGRDVIKNGIYFPFFIMDDAEEEGQMTIYEGNHRGLSLKLLQFLGEIDENYKVPCLILPEKLKCFKDADFCEQIDFKIGIRHILETKYTCKVLTDELIYKKAIESIEQNGGIMYNNYTIEYQTKDISDILFAPHSYALWLRDLLFPVRNTIIPSQVLNNEAFFLKWKAGEV